MNSNGIILLVEDNPDDYEATQRSFRKNHLTNPIKWCQSGQDALDYLNKTNKYAADTTHELPILILLDLNMPGMDGRELLQEMKHNHNLKKIPTIVLTTSNDPTDIEVCYSLGASTYVQKPIGFEALTAAIKTMKDYWFGIALLPAQKDDYE